MRNKKFLKIFLISVMALMLVFACAGVTAAETGVSYKTDGQISPLDFGNQNDYGGGDDWGNDDWGNNDWGNNDWGNDNYDDYNYSSGGGISILPNFLFPFIIVGVIFLYMFIRKKLGTKTRSGQVRQGSNSGHFVTVPDRTSKIEEIIKEKDPNFSAADFMTFAKEVFVDIQEDWSARDLSKVRIVMHDNLYKQTQKQVEEKIRSGIINHIENIAVSTSYLTAYKRDKQFEYVTMYLSARFIDYEAEEKTGRVIRGDKNTRWEMRYLMKFMRSTDVKTKDETNVLKSHNCPNCGAPLKMESGGICEYCGSVVTTGQYSWVLCDHTSIRNDTVDEGIKY